MFLYDGSYLDVSCNVPSINNGFSNPSRTAETGETVIYRCDNGYVLEGQYAIRCGLDGRLENSVPRCVQSANLIFSLTNII